MTSFDDFGCAICRSHWVSWSTGEPHLLGESATHQVSVYQCAHCGSYWESGTVYPRVISQAEAEERLTWQIR